MLKARSSNVLSAETRMTVVSFAAVFRDGTQRSPERGTSRKTAAKETRMTADHDSLDQRTIYIDKLPSKEHLMKRFTVIYMPKSHDCLCYK